MKNAHAKFLKYYQEFIPQFDEKSIQKINESNKIRNSRRISEKNKKMYESDDDEDYFESSKNSINKKRKKKLKKSINKKIKPN